MHSHTANPQTHMWDFEFIPEQATQVAGHVDAVFFALLGLSAFIAFGVAALIAPPEGRLGPYLASLARLRALQPRTIHPAHGPSFEDPREAVDRYVRHREARLEQVLRAVRQGPGDYDSLRQAVYGDQLEPGLERAAMAALKAYLEHLQGLGRVRRRGRGWEAA